MQRLRDRALRGCPARRDRAGGRHRRARAARPGRRRRHRSCRGRRRAAAGRGGVGEAGPSPRRPQADVPPRRELAHRQQVRPVTAEQLRSHPTIPVTPASAEPLVDARPDDGDLPGSRPRSAARARRVSMPSWRSPHVRASPSTRNDAIAAASAPPESRGLPRRSRGSRPRRAHEDPSGSHTVRRGDRDLLPPGAVLRICQPKRPEPGITISSKPDAEGTTPVGAGVNTRTPRRERPSPPTRAAGTRGTDRPRCARRQRGLRRHRAPRPYPILRPCDRRSAPSSSRSSTASTCPGPCSSSDHFGHRDSRSSRTCDPSFPARRSSARTCGQARESIASSTCTRSTSPTTASAPHWCSRRSSTSATRTGQWPSCGACSARTACSSRHP